VGGNKAFFLNHEVLFPLYEPLKLGGVVFFDVGNAFEESEPFKWSVKRSAGNGLRFASPLGAIRLDLGFNLARKHGERQEVLHFTAGTAF
jgi:outer membrane protein insertion porin family